MSINRPTKPTKTRPRKVPVPCVNCESSGRVTDSSGDDRPCLDCDEAGYR